MRRYATALSKVSGQAASLSRLAIVALFLMVAASSCRKQETLQLASASQTTADGGGGNAQGYDGGEGKKEYFQLDPTYSCSENGISLQGYQRWITNPLLSVPVLNEELCSATIPRPLSQSELEVPWYNQGLLGYGDAILTGLSSALEVPSQRQRVEAWCRWFDATTNDGVDVVIRAFPLSNDPTTAEIFLGTGRDRQARWVPAFVVSTLMDAGALVYAATGFSLRIEPSQGGEPRRLAQLEADIGGSPLSRAMSCRVRLP